MRWFAVFISLMLLCCGCASVRPQLEGGGAVEVARVPDEVFRNYLLEQGYATVTPHRIDQTDEKSLEEINKIIRG